MPVRLMESSPDDPGPWTVSPVFKIPFYKNRVCPICVLMFPDGVHPAPALVYMGVAPQHAIRKSPVPRCP